MILNHLHLSWTLNTKNKNTTTFLYSTNAKSKENLARKSKKLNLMKTIAKSRLINLKNPNKMQRKLNIFIETQLKLLLEQTRVGAWKASSITCANIRIITYLTFCSRTP